MKFSKILIVSGLLAALSAQNVQSSDWAMQQKISDTKLELRHNINDGSYESVGNLEFLLSSGSLGQRDLNIFLNDAMATRNLYPNLSIALIRNLLVAGASLDSAGYTGQGHLSLAAYDQNSKLVELLLSKSAKVDGLSPRYHKSNAEYPLLSLPTSEKYTKEMADIAEMLIKAGAKLDAEDNFGRVPLQVFRNHLLKAEKIDDKEGASHLQRVIGLLEDAERK